MTLHRRDYDLIVQFQKYLGGIGNTYLSKSRDIVTFIVSSKKDLEVLITHFNSFPLLSQKGADLILFKKVLDLMNIKAHLTIEGLIKIVNIKASINLGLPAKIIAEFPEFTPVVRPNIETALISNSNWVSGFVSGDGSFYAVVHPAPRNTVKYSVKLRFRITQHERDIKLMDTIVKHLGAGRVYKYQSQPAVYINISDFKSITNIIIPFFEKYPVYGVKANYFSD